MGKNWKQMIGAGLLLAGLTLPAVTFAAVKTEVSSCGKTSWQEPKAFDDYIVFELPKASSVAINPDGSVSLLGTDTVAAQNTNTLEAQR